MLRLNNPAKTGRRRETATFGFTALVGMVVCCGLTSILLTGGIAALGGLLLGLPSVIVVVLVIAAFALRYVTGTHHHGCHDGDQQAGDAQSPGPDART